MIRTIWDAIRATEVAIKQLPNKESSKYPGNYEHDLSYLNVVLSALQAQLDREKELDGWISVGDRLPPRYIGIIACVSNDTMNGIDFGCLNSSNQWDLKSGFYDFERVTHWMPGPKPPKEENHE